MISDRLFALIEWFVLVLALALATASMSVTLSKAKVSLGMRNWIGKRNDWLHELVNCSYCTSHWVAMFLVLVYQPVAVLVWLPLDLGISMFAVVTMSAPMVGLIVRSQETSPKTSSETVARIQELWNRKVERDERKVKET